MLYTSSDLFVINISTLLYFQDTPTQLESNISKKLNFDYRAAQIKTLFIVYDDFFLLQFYEILIITHKFKPVQGSKKALSSIHI